MQRYLTVGCQSLNPFPINWNLEFLRANSAKLGPGSNDCKTMVEVDNDDLKHLFVCYNPICMFVSSLYHLYSLSIVSL